MKLRTVFECTKISQLFSPAFSDSPSLSYRWKGGVDVLVQLMQISSENESKFWSIIGGDSRQIYYTIINMLKAETSSESGLDSERPTIFTFFLFYERKLKHTTTECFVSLHSSPASCSPASALRCHIVFCVVCGIHYGTFCLTGGAATGNFVSLVCDCCACNTQDRANMYKYVG